MAPAAGGGVAREVSPELTFPALGQPKHIDVTPPDTNGAVGPRHLMVALNSQVAIQDRGGRTLKAVALKAFWRRTGVIDAFDPRVLYDPYGRRWILSAASAIIATTPTSFVASSLLIGVSRTANPLRRWDFYRIEVDATTRLSADAPQIGFNTRWIVAQTLLAGSGVLRPGQLIHAFDKADLYGGGAGKFTGFFVSDDVPVAPLVTYDPSLETMHLLQLATPSSDQAELHVYTITGPIGGETLTLQRVLPVPDVPFRFAGELAPQRGSPVRIDVGDSSRLSAVYRNGSLWAVHSVSKVEPEARSAIQWWRLDGSTGNVLDGGLIEDPTRSHFYAYPSIAVNRSDDALIGYSRFSASEYPSAAYSFRSATDAPGTLREDHVVKSGEGPYVIEGSESERNRWGDYSATVVDPRNDRDMWTIQEYAKRGNRWGTWWARISPHR